ncbi:MAG: ROK family protein [Bifidobacteriaceae bacterium]|jgi:glucokinase|nr:ROK family protein [Bifidobacteriaceae bacterium]
MRSETLAAPSPATVPATAPGTVPATAPATAVAQPPVLGLDIGGTKLAAAVVGQDGSTHGWQVEPTHRERGPADVIGRLFAMGRRAVAAAGLDQPVQAVGVSCGGPLDADRGVLLAPFHLPGWVDVPIVAMAEAEFGLPAGLRNDASAAVLAEHAYGAGRGLATVVYLTISTGVGGGMVMDGRLHLGAAGNGGELGHLTVRPGGRACSCGRRGCLEAYCSGTSIARRGEEAARSARDGGVASLLDPAQGVTAQLVAAAAAQGDPVALGVWRETTDLLGQALTDLVNVLEPDAVILGGGVTRSGAMLLDPVREIVRRTGMGPARRAAQVRLAGLGDAVCVVGAGMVGRDALAATTGGDMA